MLHELKHDVGLMNICIRCGRLAVALSRGRIITIFFSLTETRASKKREAFAQSLTRGDSGGSLQSFFVKVGDNIENSERREGMNSGSSVRHSLKLVESGEFTKALVTFSRLHSHKLEPSRERTRQ